MKTMKKLRLDLYFNDIELESSNKFPSFIEYNTTSNLAWQSWQYINSYNDWYTKKTDESKRHKLQSKFTGTTIAGTNHLKGAKE